MFGIFKEIYFESKSKHDPSNMNWGTANKYKSDLLLFKIKRLKNCFSEIIQRLNCSQLKLFSQQFKEDTLKVKALYYPLPRKSLRQLS